MSDKKEEAEAPAKPSPVKTLMGGAITAVVLGGVAAGGAFMIPSGSSSCAPVEVAHEEAKEETKDYKDVAFVNLEPLVISLGGNASSRYLKISISLETTVTEIKTIEHLTPKFRDVLNTYLRAVEERDLTEPSAMNRLRAQMLRRMQLVAPTGAVENVLITEFVLN